jgi:hypothetical protein
MVKFNAHRVWTREIHIYQSTIKRNTTTDKQMKTIIFLFVLLSSITLSAQKTTDSRDYYLRKSKNQKTVGNVLIVTGGLLLFSNIFIPSGEPSRWTGLGPNDDIKLGLTAGALICGLASIPFFASSRANSRRAVAISISGQKIMIPQPKAMSLKMQPAICVRYVLRK